jgi:hypothetical protein
MYQASDFVEHSPFSEADSRSVGQDLPAFIPPLDFVSYRFNPVHTLTPYFFKMCFLVSIHMLLDLPSGASLHV